RRPLAITRNAFGIRPRGRLRRPGGVGRGPGAIASLRVSPGIWLSYLLPDQRGNRAPGERAYPLARPRLDEGDREGPSRAGSGRAHLPGFVRGGERGRRQLLSALESRSEERRVGKGC